jgi:hypothetical protein
VRAWWASCARRWWSREELTNDADAYRSGTVFCIDKSVTAVVIQGLAEHKDSLGAPLCPCRHYDDKDLEAEQGYWNCPCVPMRERKVRPPIRRSRSLAPAHLTAHTMLERTCRRSATACCSSTRGPTLRVLTR